MDVSIVDRLSHMVHQYRKDHYGDYPNLITIHPLMRARLIDAARHMITIPQEGKDFRFMGVRVVRSMDVTEEEILIT